MGGRGYYRYTSLSQGSIICYKQPKGRQGNKSSSGTWKIRLVTSRSPRSGFPISWSDWLEVSKGLAIVQEGSLPDQPEKGIGETRWRGLTSKHINPSPGSILDESKGEGEGEHAAGGDWDDNFSNPPGLCCLIRSQDRLGLGLSCYLSHQTCIILFHTYNILTTIVIWPHINFILWYFSYFIKIISLYIHLFYYVIMDG